VLPRPAVQQSRADDRLCSVGAGLGWRSPPSTRGGTLLASARNSSISNSFVTCPTTPAARRSAEGPTQLLGERDLTSMTAVERTAAARVAAYGSNSPVAS
jgi:hypothetical protein